ncbi:MAG: hypothetical protein SO168_08720, partial [Muribaculaceae bacterium]|nr:hypothetical protein [Muribaculaceae bacterium]
MAHHLRASAIALLITAALPTVSILSSCSRAPRQHGENTDAPAASTTANSDANADASTTSGA